MLTNDQTTFATRPTRSHARWIIAAFAAVAVVALAMNCVGSSGAAPAQSKVIAQSELLSQAGMIDRSRKGDRLRSVAPAIEAELPEGCDSPFSPLAKLAPANLIARCLT
jgi:hypothetical protein